MFSSNPRLLPQRTHSVNAVKHANYFGSIDEELQDCKRVQRQGQEEDLREALTRMMARVEELRETLKSTYHQTTDLETQLTLAESNLKLALANNEMLEDALKSGSLSKDVGWRRSSRETGPLQPAPSPPVTASLPASQSQQTNISESDETEGGAPAPDSSGSDRDSCPPSPAPPPLADLRFFRFRLTGSGRSTPTQPRTSSTRASRSQSTSHPAVGHLTSASLPSLVTPPAAVDSELEELREQLLTEKRKSEKITREKSELESELESLSQALFEEANKMVKVERIKRAEAEDELKEVHAEKDALRAALRLIEEHRMRAESSHQPHVKSFEQTTAPTHSRSSSQEAIVSPRQRPRDSPTPPSSPPPTTQPPEVAISTNLRDTEDTPPSPAPPSPAPLYVPPPHLVDSAPASRTASPKPLPHPHRLSHLRTGAPPPAPPPPSAADGFPNSPWARPLSGEEDDTDEAAETGFSVPKIVTLYSPPDESEMAVPWGKW